MRRIGALLVAALVAAATLTAGAQPAQAAVAANNTCHQVSGAPGAWTPTHVYTFNLYYFDITHAPVWCANMNGGRLVIQNNGDLTLWNREVSGGSLIWHTPAAANHGARQFRLQGDGNVAIYNQYGDVLWAAANTYGGIDGFHDCATNYYLDAFNNRWEWRAHVRKYSSCWYTGFSEKVTYHFPV